MKTIVFLIKRPDEIPPVAPEGSAPSMHGASEFYFGKYLTPAGIESIGLVSYDFKNQKWRACTNGFSQLVEYYVNDENFNKWMHNINKLDTMLEIFNAFDDEDK